MSCLATVIASRFSNGRGVRAHRLQERKCENEAPSPGVRLPRARWLPVLCLGVTLFVTLAAGLTSAATPAVDTARLREQVAALGTLTSPPVVYPAEGFAAEGLVRPLFFESLPWQGKPTRVFAWLGLPANRAGKVPGVVLVHGGGGTAFKEWAQQWAAH